MPSISNTEIALIIMAFVILMLTITTVIKDSNVAKHPIPGDGENQNTSNPPRTNPIPPTPLPPMNNNAGVTP